VSRISPGGERIAQSVRRAVGEGRLALAPFITGGFPDRDSFPALLAALGREADLIEVGVPFSDPMADGVTIQRASERALSHGVTLEWILGVLRVHTPVAPVVLMSYLNPVLRMGLDDFARQARTAGVCGLIVPDLPYEEADPVRRALDAVGVGLVQLVTPESPMDRLERLCRASRGFVYAVTMAGTTGASVAGAYGGLREYLGRVRNASDLPVLAGFGIRSREDVAALEGHVDGVIVGSAVIEAIERGEDPAKLIQGLRAQPREERTS
jgi:tryptophan synthase alpha chain